MSAARDGEGLSVYSHCTGERGSCPPCWASDVTGEYLQQFGIVLPRHHDAGIEATSFALLCKTPQSAPALLSSPSSQLTSYFVHIRRLADPYTDF